MSIWSSVGGEDARALEWTDDSNYRAKGDPRIVMDVATALGFHDHIRLSWFPDGGSGPDGGLILPPDAAELLRDQLDAAVGAVRERHSPVQSVARHVQPHPDDPDLELHATVTMFEPVPIPGGSLDRKPRPWWRRLFRREKR